MKVYIAAPFFNPTQLLIVEGIKEILIKNNIQFFSPKDESMFKQGDNPKDILDLNCRAILTSDAVVAVTDGKDVGTMFECGYAYSHLVPIIYVWLDKKEGEKFNLMLAASGSVIHCLKDIPSALYNNFGLNYKGIIE